MSAPARPRRKRILFIILGCVTALLAAAWLILPAVVEPILRRKLESLVATHLHVELKLADLSYRFPYTVRVSDVRLVARGGSRDGHELLRLANGTLALDELPLGRGPLRIRSIELDRPALHVVRDANGDVLQRELLVRADEARPQPGERMKLSDLFRLRRLTLRGGKVTYEDRGRPDAPPMVWDNLSTDLTIVPREAAVYDFRYGAGGAPDTAQAHGLGRGTLPEISARGSIDIDRLVLVIDQLVLTGRAGAHADQTSVPAVIQEFVHKHEIAGAVRVEGAGTVPLREPRSASGKATVELDGGRAHVWRYDRTLDRLDLRLELEKAADRQELSVRLPKLVAQAAPARVDVEGASGTVDWQRQVWRLSVPNAQTQFTGPASAGSIALALDIAGSLERGRINWDQTSGRATLHDVTLQPPRFPQPITHVNGSTEMTGGTMLAHGLSGRYGADVWSVASARVSLIDLPDRFQVSEIVATAKFAPPSPAYPTALSKTIAELRPEGPFNIAGNFTRDRASSGPRNQWDLVVTSDGGAFTVTGRDVPLTSIRGEARVTRESIEVRRFLANAFDGALAASGSINPRKPVSYTGEVSAENVDLRQLVERFRDAPGATANVTGRLGGSVSIESEGGPVEMLRATGEATVHDGVLWEVPVLRDVVGKTNVARDALRAGEAGAMFEIKDGVVHVRHAVVSSPTLGLQGWGTIDLRDGDGHALDLDVVAAPLGDWEAHLKKTKVPIVSDVAGAVAGTMQKVLNTATSTLLYEFRVTGTLSKPHLSAVPAPVLTEAVAVVFHGMLKREKDLMKSIRARSEPSRERRE